MAPDQANCPRQGQPGQHRGSRFRNDSTCASRRYSRTSELRLDNLQIKAVDDVIHVNVTQTARVSGVRLPDDDIVEVDDPGTIEISTDGNDGGLDDELVNVSVEVSDWNKTAFCTEEGEVPRGKIAGEFSAGPHNQVFVAHLWRDRICTRLVEGYL